MLVGGLGPDEVGKKNRSGGRAGRQTETYPIVVLVKIVSDHRLVPRQCLFEVGEGVAGDAEGGCLDVMRIVVEPGIKNVSDVMGYRDPCLKGSSRQRAHLWLKWRREAEELTSPNAGESWPAARASASP